MRVVIYGGTGWIGQQCYKKLRERKVPVLLAEHRIGKNSDEEVRSLLNYFDKSVAFYLKNRTVKGRGVFL